MGQPAGFSFTTTAQQIINSVSQDMRKQLGTSGADSTILLDYVDRVQKEILRLSRWPYSLSDRQYFITALEQTDYWLGPSGQGPSNAVDTALNLNNIFRIEKDSFFDVSNRRQLIQVKNAPLGTTLNNRSGLYRKRLPAVWRQDPITPNTVQLYPAPDNQNNYQPVPNAPVISTTTTGGALANRIYYVGCTFLDNDGNEGTATDNYAKSFVPSGQLATVLSPTLPLTTTASGALYSKYNIYASTTQGTVGTLQNSTPIALGTNWTEPTSGLTTTGVQPPLSSALIPMDGYLMQFRYYQSRPAAPVLTTVLSIPDDYNDVIKSGVNVLAFKLASRTDDVEFWQQQYTKGVQQIIADKNLFPAGANFIRPDTASVTGQDFGSIGLADIFNQ